MAKVIKKNFRLTESQQENILLSLCIFQQEMYIQDPYKADAL